MKSSSVRKLIASVIVLTIVITLGIFGHGRAVSMARKAQLGILCRQYSLSITSTMSVVPAIQRMISLRLCRKQFKPLKSEYPYEISVYNTFRVEERKQLKELLGSGINVMLISPRRWGKSSLVKVAMDELTQEDKHIRVCFIDAFSIKTEAEFYRIFAREVISCAASTLERGLKM